MIEGKVEIKREAVYLMAIQATLAYGASRTDTY